jgi:Glycosyl transferase family 2
MSRHRITVVALIAAFNEADILEHVLDDLHRQGIDVYFLDDGSTDSTRAIAEARLGRGVLAVDCLRPPGDAANAARFDWTGILRRKEQLAAEIDADWFIHHDADEFREAPWAGVSLADGIARVDRAGFNAIDFALFDFPPTDESFVPGGDVRESLRYCEPGRTWNRQQVKCWKRTAERVDLTSSGGHDVQFPGRRVYPLRFVLRHYPIRSSAHGQQKVINERLSRFSEVERARGWHVQYANIADAPFVRDAASLQAYDPATVRAEIATADLERTEAERAELARECAALREELKAARAAQQALLILERRLDAHRAEQEHLLGEIQAIYQSASWKITAPLRALVQPLISRSRR